MDTKEYVVTDFAGPKVAGAQAQAGETVILNEPQARAELLAGAIVPKGKEQAAVTLLDGSKKLPDIQARARGAESAKDEADASAPQPPAAAEIQGTDTKLGGTKPAGA